MCEKVKLCPKKVLTFFCGSGDGVAGVESLNKLIDTAESKSTSLLALKKVFWCILYHS